MCTLERCGVATYPLARLMHILQKAPSIFCNPVTPQGSAISHGRLKKPNHFGGGKIPKSLILPPPKSLTLVRRAKMPKSMSGEGVTETEMSAASGSAGATLAAAVKPMRAGRPCRSILH